MTLTLPKACPAPKNTSAKGVCFFDVDGTLTQDQFKDLHTRAPVEACLRAGWDVGVSSASTRTWQAGCEKIGNAYKAKGHHGIAGGWLTDAMCENMAKNDFVTFNSNVMFAGKELEDSTEIDARPGAKKSMLIGGVMEDCFPGLPSVLFDNNPNWCEEARHYRKDNSCKLSHIEGVHNLPNKGVTHAYCMASAQNAASCQGNAQISHEDWVTGNIAQLLPSAPIPSPIPPPSPSPTASPTASPDLQKEYDSMRQMNCLNGTGTLLKQRAVKTAEECQDLCNRTHECTTYEVDGPEIRTCFLSKNIHNIDMCCKPSKSHRMFAWTGRPDPDGSCQTRS